MENIYIQRKVEIWIEETYRVEEINDKTIEAAINYEIDVDDTETLWETRVDLDPIEVYDKNGKLIYKKDE